MTKVDAAKIKILDKLKTMERVIAIEFDGVVDDEKPMGWRFYRLNIFYINEDGEATFGSKGVYIKTTTGECLLHSGGVQTKSLTAEEIVEEPPEKKS